MLVVERTIKVKHLGESVELEYITSTDPDYEDGWYYSEDPDGPPTYCGDTEEEAKKYVCLAILFY